jgi:tRNA nucleotidyltransferase (CCA-adding enzyme)
MVKSINLVDRINKRLPEELVDFIHQAGSVAEKQKQKLYLVGGVVRDLLLERSNLDLDLVAEGDAIKLANELADIKKGKVIAHSRFNTAKIRWDKWSVDIATARAEGYEKPGALPAIRPTDIQSDLIRRDFTINAMAVYLDPSRFGELIDLFGGRDDLDRKFIRMLHDNSFRDDATRIWRAARYEQRLSFSLEPHTLELLKRDLSYLDTISGNRVRHELELCLEEERSEKVLLRAGALGILAQMCPSLEADHWLAKKFSRSRGMMQPYCPPQELYLAFLIYRLSPKDLADLIAYLKFPRIVATALKDTIKLKNELTALSQPEMTPGKIYRCLYKYSQTVILANLIATDLALVRQRIELYLNRLRHIHSSLTGDDLLKAGIASGPRIKEALEFLREARLDGKVKTREAEIALLAKMGKASN